MDTEDIKYLLSLEALKKAKRNEAEVRKKVDNARKNFEQAENNYNSVFTKYMQLVTLGATRGALKKKILPDIKKLEECENAAVKIIEDTESVTDYLDESTLCKFKEFLSSIRQHENLKNHQIEIANNVKTLESIGKTQTEIQSNLAFATVQGIECLADRLAVDADTESSVNNNSSTLQENSFNSPELIDTSQ